MEKPKPRKIKYVPFFKSNDVSKLQNLEGHSNENGWFVKKNLPKRNEKKKKKKTCFRFQWWMTLTKSTYM